MNGTTWLDRTNYFETLPSHQLDLGALARGGPHGDAARGAEPGEPRQPARGREEREALVLRQPAVRLVAGEAPGAPVPARATRTTTRRSGRWRTSTPPRSRTSAPSSGPTTPRTTRSCRSSATSTRRPSARSAERFFGAIPANPTIPPLATCRCRRRSVARSARPSTTGCRCRASTSASGRRSFGDPRLDALDVAGQILAGGKGSRLHRRLVRDERIAQDVALFTLGLHRRRVGLRRLGDGPPGRDASSASRPRSARGARAAAPEPVSDDELARAFALIEADELGALQRVEERADRLSMYATLFDDPGLINEMLGRYLAVDAGGDPRGRGGDLPAGQPARPDLPARDAAGRDVTRRRGRRTRTGRTRRWPHDRQTTGASATARRRGAPDARRRHDRTTSPRSSATRARQRPDRRSSPTCPGRPLRQRDDRPADRRRRRAAPSEGGAAVLAARALTEGTERYDAVGLTEAAERLGASLHAEAGWDATSIGIDVPADRLGAGPRARSPRCCSARRSRPTRSSACATSGSTTCCRPRPTPAGAPTRLHRHDLRAASPYHRPSGGTRETVEGLDADDRPARLRRAPSTRPGHARRRRRPRRPGRRRDRARACFGGWTAARHGGAGPIVDAMRRPGPASSASSTGRARSRPRSASATSACRDAIAGLPCGLGHERDPRRPVQLAAEHAAPRGEGLHLRRGRRASTCAVAPARSRPAPRSTPRSPSRPSSTRSPSSSGCATTGRRRASSRPRATSWSASSRCASRRRVPSSGRWPAWPSTTCRSRSSSTIARDRGGRHRRRCRRRPRPPPRRSGRDRARRRRRRVRRRPRGRRPRYRSSSNATRARRWRGDRRRRGGGRGPTDETDDAGPTAGAEDPDLPGTADDPAPDPTGGDDVSEDVDRGA